MGADMITEAGLLQTRLQELAQRIIHAARLAASTHLSDAFHQSMNQYGRRIEIGGADPVSPDDQGSRHDPVARVRPASSSLRDGAD
jgi:hypothetical protein